MDDKQLTLKERLAQLSNLFTIGPTLIDDKSINCELLIDLLIAVYTDIQRNARPNRDKNSPSNKFCDFVRPLIERINNLQLRSNDFEQLKIIGKGAFGQVLLVKCKETQNVFAMKVLNKLEMAKRAEKACYKEERDILLHGSKEWFTKLHYAFQDCDNLYLVMDYYIGGDFLTLLSKYDDTLPEDMCRFYAMQMILAISALHELGYIHRDIKPHNILIDSSGHIRLADFGSCVKAAFVKSDTSTPVGTPDYISPEILNVIEGRNNQDTSYSFETDWWSLGIVLFESFYGETPFYAESLVETYFKIMNHKSHFMFPVNAKVTDEAKDLIANLITDRVHRYKMIDQFKSHPWFTGIDWDSVRYQVPPYQPNFDGPDDTSNFDISDIKPINNPITTISSNKDINIELSFVGFSATLNSVSPDISSLPESNVKPPSESQSISLSTPVENESDALEKINLLENHLKSAKQEWSEMFNLLTEMKKEKNILSDKLRIKEEELDEQIEKNSQLRTQLRNYEKTKRQHIEEIANLQGEVNTVRIVRKQDQNTIKDLEDRLELLENQLKHDTESSKLLSNEKQVFLKQISDLEQQLLNIEEENMILKGENAEQRKYVQEMNLNMIQMNKFNCNYDDVLKTLTKLSSKQQSTRSTFDQMLEVVEYNVKKYKYLLDKNGGKVDPNMMTLSKNNPSWQERRSARVDKQELLTLQLELNNEILDKQKIQSELAKLQHDFDNIVIQLNESKNEVNRLKKQVKSFAQEGTSSETSKFERKDSDSEYGDNSFLKDYIPENNTLMSIANKRQSVVGIPQDPNENFDYHNKFGHSFIIRTFITPIKCYICTSLMIGLVRQGYVCEVCGYACHVNCVDLGSPCPFDETKQRPVGIDPKKGIGTAYEGYVKIPKARGGVRKGWIRMYVVVCDFKLFLYDIMNTGDAQSVGLNYSNISNMDPNYSTLINTPSVSANTIIDMRDEHFSVNDVTESDVIHASPKDIPCIFRITTSMIGDQREGLQIFTQLMLVDKESEKHKWIDALHELHRIIRRNKIPHRNILRNYHLLNTLQISSLRHINNVHCCTMIDETRLLIGCEDSIICCDLDIHSYHRLNHSKRFYQMVYIHSEQLVVALSGKQKQIKLIPIRALDNESIEWIKISESKNATTFTVAYDNSIAYVCVAIRKTLHIFEITHKKARYLSHHEVHMPVNIQTLNTCRDNLIAVGTSSNFLVYHVNRSEQPLYLVNQESPDLIYLIQNSIDPLLCEPINDNEWLLIFVHYGVYVDNHGKRTRCVELQYPSQPSHASILRSNNHNVNYLMIFSKTHIDVFNINQTKWVQTINLKETKPLQTFGENMLICITNALDLPNLVQIAIDSDMKIKVHGDNIKAFTLKNLNQKNIASQSSDLKKNTKIQISAPTDFSHISHLGPGVGPFTSNLIDLNNLKDTLQRPPSKESMSKSHSSLHYKN